MTNLRIIEPADISHINSLISSAFTYGREQDGYASIQVAPSRNEMLHMYLSSCPEGCFLAEEQNRIVAVSFSHVWGRTGWIGPIAVVPERQGEGLGHAVTVRSIDFLKDSGCDTIGLETMPRSYRNLGFYGKLGFLPQQLTYEMMRKVLQWTRGDKEIALAVSVFSQCRRGTRKRFLQKTCELTGSVSQGIDYTSLVRGTVDFHFGDVYLFERNKRVEGFAVAHSEPYSIGEKRNVLRAIAVVVDGSRPEEVFADVVAYLGKIAYQKRLAHLCIRVPANHGKVIQWLLAEGFKIVHSDLRMTMEGYPERFNSRAIHLSRWE